MTIHIPNKCPRCGGEVWCEDATVVATNWEGEIIGEKNKYYAACEAGCGWSMREEEWIERWG